MRPRQIRQKLRALRKRQGAVLLAGLSDAIRRHAESGELPDDPMARAFVQMNQAAQRAMDLSVGGGDQHDQACQQFTAAHDKWQHVLQEHGL